MAESFKYANNKGHAGELHQKANKDHPVMTTAQGCPISAKSCHISGAGKSE